MSNTSLEKAMFWYKEKNKVRCTLCGRKCLIKEGATGACGVRKNVKNKLYSLNYGKIAAINFDPIEKKPLFHFLPGSLTLSYSSFGCNFKCSFCCNWNITQQVPSDVDEMEPEDLIELAEKNNVEVIAHTYAEPTVFFEFAYQVAKLAHRSNIYNVFVTNGYMSEEAVKKISKYLDAATIDFKASADPQFYKNVCGVPSVSPIFKCIKQMKKHRVFLEITNLIVPQLGDNLEQFKKLVDWIVAELGSEIPLHVIRFYPSYKLLDLPPTSVEVLNRFIREARMAGLRYVYIGNVIEHPAENTYCYNCRELLIERSGVEVKRINLVNGRCPTCGFKINIVME